MNKKRLAHESLTREEIVQLVTARILVTVHAECVMDTEVSARSRNWGNKWRILCYIYKQCAECAVAFFLRVNRNQCL
jgi:hypothetical protein